MVSSYQQKLKISKKFKRFFGIKIALTDNGGDKKTMNFSRLNEEAIAKYYRVFSQDIETEENKNENEHVLEV